MPAEKATFSLRTVAAMAALPRSSSQPAPVPLAPGRGADAAGMMTRLARIADIAGVPAPRLMADYAALSLGPGRPTLTDYERLRLFDDGLWGAADRREVVGARRAYELALQANPRADAFALATDRLAAAGYLAAHGLPTVPTLAVYRAGLASPGRSLLRTRDELREFLQAHAAQPLVAQPAEGGRPRLLFAGKNPDPAADIDRLVGETGDAPGVSWMLQPLTAPHPSYAALTGGRLAPVQLLAVAFEGDVQVIRALWRLGGCDDLVASLDLRTGRALALFAAARPHLTEAAPADLAVPDWEAMKATVGEAARLFSQFGLLGFEAAPGAGGPVILGLDPTPDFELPQLADRRGMLDATFQAFLAERRSLFGG
jgi:hypothetical protein